MVSVVIRIALDLQVYFGEITFVRICSFPIHKCNIFHLNIL